MTTRMPIDAPLTPDQCERLDEWYGPDTYEQDNPNGVAYLPRGSFGPWCAAQGLADDYLYLVAEEVRAEITYRQQRLFVHGRSFDHPLVQSYGSAASRRPSPMKLNARMATARARHLVRIARRYPSRTPNSIGRRSHRHSGAPPSLCPRVATPRSEPVRGFPS